MYNFEKQKKIFDVCTHCVHIVCVKDLEWVNPAIGDETKWFILILLALSWRMRFVCVFSLGGGGVNRQNLFGFSFDYFYFLRKSDFVGCNFVKDSDFLICTRY